MFSGSISEWRSRSANVASSLTLRQLSAVLPPDQAWGLWASRQIVARIMDTFGPTLSGTTTVPVDTRTSDGRRVVGEWVCGRGVAPDVTARRGIYFVHGSGYALCSPRTHRRLTSWLSQLTGLPVFSIDYRLAPRHRFPTAADDVRAGWDWLTGDRGMSPEHLVIAGDSAGGHLAVDLLLQPEVSHPAALVLLSPLLDLTFGLARTWERTGRDPAIRSRDAARLVELYCAGVDPVHPRLALDVAGGRLLPATLIHAGGAEMLAADAVALADDLRRAGGECDLRIWPDQVHVFQALPRLTPSAARSMREITAFITNALCDTSVGQVG
ncbi:acetyl esterase/lipase [Mycolicibacterium sp. BK556]|uniref:alpha/beta hydrolase n=1 Tax=Mycobacteriaceae TaxID=1762 RepID=UPI00105B3035|nr:MULTISPECIES: alpha/beta hydrolase [Mycobacteriaceae]MBB3601007.1 acetyl esterase/lipase [Mycolicibacterium sp. BK556]MBB3630761.1 acetyl esterase/lipase [Mycolicibacterium sp. BK607]MBB3748757.1 acetyl esterase/lipase [Mycolicibacterium sp. BK634]TDO15052.1 acetyl esterase/lipase [Mycobacterium sp. BK086]